ncbi:hypothetical protein OPT61_g2789 [Boeremia exigua]|uniref:Uncharacterized protein n=1 Tax=Boeremia exigua TaxID=749465 RepID=A0ACC2IK90_9PLEO|nr:hypothetical protein OPT61_g2789 [Boeremia exigua]
MRTGIEVPEFFEVGRVFAMVFTESVGGNSIHSPSDDAFDVIRYGETVYSQIRRFVVVSTRRGFVLACAISAYSNRGTLKHGLDPKEHAVVYNTGTDPELCYLPGERERGLYKRPIEVSPANSSSHLVRESRIRFGKVYAIEWNVKVKDLGHVIPTHLEALKDHYKEEEMRWDQSSL